MTHNPDYLSDDFLADTLRHMKEMEDGMPLYECLVAMQVGAGLSYEEAEANAARCITATAAREALFARVSDDAMAVMDRFLDRLTVMDPAARMDALHRILFGLTAYNDPACAALLDADTPVMEVYEKWLDTRPLHGAAFSGIEDEIRQALQSYSLSPAAMKKLTRQMLSGKGCLAAAEAMGQRGRNLKCLMTMELWMHNRQLSMEEAANIAASSAEIQATADAVQRSYIARDTARKILIAVAVTAVIAGAALAVYHGPILLEALQGATPFPMPTGARITGAELAALQQSACRQAVYSSAPWVCLGGILALGGSVMVFLSKACADAIARISTRFSELHTAAGEAVEADLSDLAEKQERPPVVVYAQYPENLEILEDEDPESLIF